MAQWLIRQGYDVNRKRVQLLMRVMGLEAIYPRRRTSVPCPEHRIYPYLLRNVAIERPDQVWSADITYVPLRRGFMCLVAVLDWHSRYVLSWELSNALDSSFCVAALEAALESQQPEIFNTDQGAQFTSQAFTNVLEAAGIGTSMDGRGRALDNVFIERLWRTVKYEHIYLHGYESTVELERGLASYFDFYCYERLHMALGYRTPLEAYWKGGVRVVRNENILAQKFLPAARLTKETVFLTRYVSVFLGRARPVRGLRGPKTSPCPTPKPVQQLGSTLSNDNHDCSSNGAHDRDCRNRERGEAISPEVSAI